MFNIQHRSRAFEPVHIRSPVAWPCLPDNSVGFCARCGNGCWGQIMSIGTLKFAGGLQKCSRLKCDDVIPVQSATTESIDVFEQQSVTPPVLWSIVLKQGVSFEPSTR